MAHRASPRLISVIVPVLDAAEHLPQQLEALAGQDYPGRWEAVIADNGSTDGSVELALRRLGDLPGGRLVRAGVAGGAGGRVPAGRRARAAGAARRAPRRGAVAAGAGAGRRVPAGVRAPGGRSCRRGGVAVDRSRRSRLTSTGGSALQTPR